MRFVVEHKLPGTIERLEALIADPRLYDRLAPALPGIERIELLASDEADGRLHRRVRYTPRAHASGRVPAFGRGIITPEMLVWIEESVFDRAAHRIDYRITPNLPARWRDRFDSHGAFTLRAEPGGVVRRVDGEVVVRVPIVGAIAERLLVKEVRAGFDADAAVLAGWLR
ncbi:MAG TPA: DUF2505 family protein [Polyangia bacterium]|jgi:hypothetical protein